MTKRPIKSMPNDRVYMTPFNLVNQGTGENVYMYNMKGRWPHGGDRLCTVLYHVIRRIKFKDDVLCNERELAQKKARKLVLIGDNYSENKNNTMFAFCSELVARKWYDEVEMLFGPVGHTHNGNDAVHYIHNQIAGNFASVTPCELFNAFPSAWHNEVTRPQPIIVETQYAWKLRYQPNINNVSGGISNPAYVRGFRFARSNLSMAVEMMVKGSPSAPKWYGQFCGGCSRISNSQRCAVFVPTS